MLGSLGPWRAVCCIVGHLCTCKAMPDELQRCMQRVEVGTRLGPNGDLLHVLAHLRAACDVWQPRIGAATSTHLDEVCRWRRG